MIAIKRRFFDSLEPIIYWDTSFAIAVDFSESLKAYYH